ncbi:MAG TPA: phage baseplate assembly protein V [Polyangia bacterium]|jgi:phage baseplate assembly protein gpV|nr:phage baseplate assembly protein V [Polyangia bacterium]
MTTYFERRVGLEGRREARFPGVYAAHVESVDDPLQLGQIQVSVPSIFDTSDPEAHVWARPCFPANHFTVPKVGDQVWVMFENGDPTRPIWFGVWYPTGGVPTEAKPGQAPQRQVIQSPKGQVIVIDETDGAEQIYIQDKAGNRIELRTGGVLILCKQDLTIDASGHNIVIKAASVDVKKA